MFIITITLSLFFIITFVILCIKWNTHQNKCEYKNHTYLEHSGMGPN
jgi:preprotein translocase subunit SecG